MRAYAYICNIMHAFSFFDCRSQIQSQSSNSNKTCVKVERAYKEMADANMSIDGGPL